MSGVHGGRWVCLGCWGWESLSEAVGIGYVGEILMFGRMREVFHLSYQFMFGNIGDVSFMLGQIKDVFMFGYMWGGFSCLDISGKV